jgi:hypothetical protein
MNPKRDPEPRQKAPIPDSSAGPTERDPEDREVNPEREREVKDKMMDKTLADSYPASDPPSTIPDPSEEDSLDAEADKGEAA